MADVTSAELIGTRLIVWNFAEAVRLYRTGFFGKPVGIPKPKPEQEFKAPLILDLMEGLYLLDRKMINVTDAKTGKSVTRAKLLKLANRTYKQFNLGYMAYENLREKGLIVTPGIRFGSDFAIYEHGPGIDHAPFIVTVKKEQETMGPFEVVLAGRLATTVRKQFTIAVPNRRSKVDYLVFRWFKA
ncbi:MAG TPA: tRNA-intron lyase [Candidatus Acidoferrales bacterium]|nr:tRNA-intron lyase [Candidatus Acidoferrales bacterium]